MTVITKVNSSGPAGYAAAAGIGAGPVSLEPYRSQEFFELERDKVFRKAWLLIGRVEEVAKAGDFVVKDVEICGVSLLIAHGKDGKIRAFHNVCPHRANQVVWEREGNSSVFMCRYHNWAFSTDGKLRGVPDQEMFIGLDKSQCNLQSVSLEVWDGWMFINLAKEPEISLDDFLGQLKNVLGGLEYLNASHPIIIQSILKCNWKVVADAFVEAYHIPAIHQTSIKTMFSNSDNMFGRLLDAQFFAPHRTNSMFGNADYQPTAEQAVERLAYDPAYMQPAYLESLGRFATHPAVNPTRDRNWSMDVNFVFPNTHIDANRGGFFLHQFWPINVNETRHEARFYAAPAANIRERFAQEYAIAHAIDIILEDLSNVERTQRGINSRGTDQIQLSESEVLIRHNLHQLHKWTQADTVAAAMAPETAGA